MKRSLRRKSYLDNRKEKIVLDQRGTNQHRMLVPPARNEVWPEYRCVWRSGTEWKVQLIILRCGAQPQIE